MATPHAPHALSASDAVALRRALRGAQLDTDNARALAKREAARADAMAAEAAGARRAAAGATAELERVAREVLGLRAARDAAAASLEDTAAYAKKLENKVAGSGGFLVEQNARLRAALGDATAAHAVRGGRGRGRGSAPRAGGVSHSPPAANPPLRALFARRTAPH